VPNPEDEAKPTEASQMLSIVAESSWAWEEHLYNSQKVKQGRDLLHPLK